MSLITSQIDTAPKLRIGRQAEPARLITSQIDTAPKLLVCHPSHLFSLITSQIDTAPKPHPSHLQCSGSFDYQSD